jgi:hypothetical protein
VTAFSKEVVMSLRSRLVPVALAFAAAGVLAPLARGEEGPAPRPDAVRPAPEPEQPRAIDLVIGLDTSGSMEGLIHAARQKIWSVVSQLATAKPTPTLRVALLTYGSPGDAEAGYVVVQTDFTTDLDLVSERLFALTTNGGDEYVARVVKDALDRLTWTPGDDAARILFVAGNEGASQDPLHRFQDQAQRAVARGVVVNAIYCGGADDADATGYRELAALGRGRYASIDHNAGTVIVQTPFDEELARLSAEINATYVAYGERAKEARERQTAQDENASGAGAPAAAERAAAKASDLYDNAGWDLVDRMDEEGFDLAKIPVEQLPEDMRPMTLEQRAAHLKAKKAERARIQERIRELDAKRTAYVTAEMSKQELDDTKALDRALRDAIREQAEKKGFTFD